MVAVERIWPRCRHAFCKHIAQSHNEKGECTIDVCRCIKYDDGDIERTVSEVIDYFASRSYPLTVVSISREARERGYTDAEIGSLPEQLLALKGYVRQGYVRAGE